MAVSPEGYVIVRHRQVGSNPATVVGIGDSRSPRSTGQVGLAEQPPFIALLDRWDISTRCGTLPADGAVGTSCAPRWRGGLLAKEPGMDPRGPLGSPHAKREPPFALGAELSKARSLGCDSSLLLWLLLCAPQQ